MYIHREGYKILSVLTAVLIIINLYLYTVIPGLWWLVLIPSLVVAYLFFQFFRNPKRTIPVKDDHLVYAPADGKVVVIEEVQEDEYFKEKKIQISVFMSPLNVHVNRSPIGGKILFNKYHPGKFLVAWHPKSSTENERTTTVFQGAYGTILLRQIAGAVARRIKNYPKEGDVLAQGQEYGFIKFGSRVDIFLPLDAEIVTTIDEVVKGNKTVLAKLK